MAKRNVPASTHRQVSYEPPDSNRIYQYAQNVCNDIAETIDPEFDTPEIRSELANFIKVIAEIGADQMNKRTQMLDTESSQR